MTHLKFSGKDNLKKEIDCSLNQSKELVLISKVVLHDDMKSNPACFHEEKKQPD